MDKETDQAVDPQTSPARHPRQMGIRPFYDVIGQAPSCQPGDHATALAFVHRIEAAMLDKDRWNENDKTRLRALRQQWRRRAEGRDPRFELVGTRDGRLTADEEYKLRPKQAVARAEERAALGIKATDQRLRRARHERAIDADLPTRPAKGFWNDAEDGIDGEREEAQQFERDPEAGEIALPTIAESRQYLIPGQDGKGHAHRIYCRVMPAHYRALSTLNDAKVFGFRTVGDVMRWCIDYGIRELTRRRPLPQVKSAIAQADLIREVLNEETYYLDFPQVFDTLQSVVNKQQASGAGKEQAIRLVAMVRHLIEGMGESYWREKYMAELMRLYGHLLEDGGDQAVDFNE